MPGFTEKMSNAIGGNKQGVDNAKQDAGVNEGKDSFHGTAQTFGSDGIADVTNGNEFEIVSSPVPEEFEKIHRFWMASNYLSVGQVRFNSWNQIVDAFLLL